MIRPQPKRIQLLSRLITAFIIAAGLCLIACVFNAGASKAASPSGTDSAILQSPLYLADGASGDVAGFSVAVSGNTALVGASGHRFMAGAVPGAVAVFQRNGLVWSLQAKLVSGEPLISLGYFGYSVAIDGDIAVVGAPRYLPGTRGAVYIYRRDGTTWSLQRRIVAGAMNTGNFGWSVAISGDTIVVGDYSADGTYGIGAANVYRLTGSTWTEEARLIGPDRSEGDRFGTSVAVNGDTIVVGALADNTSVADDTGSATVFARSGTTWTQQAFLTASDAHNSDFFGSSVAINGNTIAVGAYNADSPYAVDSGAAYIFQRNGATWSEVQKLVAGDAKTDDRLGSSIAVNGNTIIAGADYYDLPTRQNTGAAYVFQRSNSVWTENNTFFLDYGAPGDLYGNGVAISDNTIITGAPNLDKNGLTDVGSGYAYIYRQSIRNTSDFDGDGKSDLAVYRPSTSRWYARQSSDGAGYFRRFGASGDIIAPGDYDGDGKTDVAVFRPTEGTWYSLNSSNNALRVRPFGLSGDVPVPGDYDGNGVTDIAVYRASNGTWYITSGIDNNVRAEQFGTAGDRPVPADYDGDGKTDLAVVRSSNNTWYIFESGSNSTRALGWGASGDVAVPADYNGDTKADVAVFRPSNGSWYILFSTLNQFQGQAWGTAGDTPAPADYNGDGKADISVFRPSNGTWYILQSGSLDLRAEQWGASGDLPVPSAFNQ